MRRAANHIALLLMSFISCVEPFPISERESESVLAVDGFISNTAKQHIVRIARTSAVNDAKQHPETGATVRISSSAGEIFSLVETSPGIYKTSFLAGTTGRKYQLFITTSSGKSYSSKEVILKATPPIGEVTARYFSKTDARDEGVQIYLDTEDVSGKTRYYRWEYEETFEIVTPFISPFEWVGGTVVLFRSSPVNRCWAMDTSRNVITASTEGLARDKVTAFPIRFVAGESQALVVRYSLLIKQFALSEESYFFWKNIRTVNEKQGSLFDVQPGPVRGNITSDGDPNEFVLGYFDAASVSEKRVFLTPDQFAADGFVPPVYRSSCTDANPVTVPSLQIGTFMGQYQGVLEIFDVTSVPEPSYLLLPRPCCNCSDDGISEKPSYWPE